MITNRYVLTYDISKTSFTINRADSYKDINELTMLYIINGETCIAKRRTIDNLWIQLNILDLPSFDKYVITIDVGEPPENIDEFMKNIIDKMKKVPYVEGDNNNG